MGPSSSGFDDRRSSATVALKMGVLLSNRWATARLASITAMIFVAVFLRGQHWKLRGSLLRAPLAVVTLRAVGALSVSAFIAAALAWCAGAGRVVAPRLGDRRVVYLGPGCGHVAYTMGFVAGMLDDREIRKTMVDTGASFGGVSSGAQTAVYAMASLRGILSVREWYEREMRNGYQLVGLHGTRVMGQEMAKGAERFYAICDEKCRGELSWMKNLVFSTTELVSFLRPRFLTALGSANSFRDAILATSYVPGLMGPQPWTSWEGCRCFDGFLGTLRVFFPENYLFVSFLPTLPHWYLRNANFLPVHRFDSTLESLPVKAWPWGDPHWADAAFERGMLDFKANEAELRGRLLAFLLG